MPETAVGSSAVLVCRCNDTDDISDGMRSPRVVAASSRSRDDVPFSETRTNAIERKSIAGESDNDSKPMSLEVRWAPHNVNLNEVVITVSREEIGDYRSVTFNVPRDWFDPSTNIVTVPGADAGTPVDYDLLQASRAFVSHPGFLSYSGHRCAEASVKFAAGPTDDAVRGFDNDGPIWVLADSGPYDLTIFPTRSAPDGCAWQIGNILTELIHGRHPSFPRKGELWATGILSDHLSKNRALSDLR